MNKQIEAMKLALEALEDRVSLNKWQKARDAVREALAEQPRGEATLAQQNAERGDPVGYFSINDYGRWEENENQYGMPFYAQPASESLTDEQINLFINGRGDKGDDDYVEPTGDGFGLTDADLVRLVRRVEAAHGITKGNT